MATAFEELRVLQDAEAVAEEIWQQVVGWDPFAREVVGGQLARAADSVGANIASRLTSLARQLNSFAGSLKAQRQGNQARLKAVRETAVEYETHSTHEVFIPFFSETDLDWLQTISIVDDQSPFSNL
jgi:hypothetical protein